MRRKDQTQTLTDAQWALLEPLLPKSLSRTRKPGCRREVLNGILHVLRTGIPWKVMPKCYPPSSTCHRQYQEWVRYGIMQAVLAKLAEDLQVRGGFDTRQLLASLSQDPLLNEPLPPDGRIWKRGQKSRECWTAELIISIQVRRALCRVKHFRVKRPSGQARAASAAQHIGFPAAS